MLRKYLQVLKIQPCSETFFVVANTLSLFPVIPEYKLDECFPELEIALLTFVCLPLTVVSFESYFNQLKRIKSYFQASMRQEMLSMNSIFSIDTRKRIILIFMLLKPIFQQQHN
jgi:hypothetical protein